MTVQLTNLSRGWLLGWNAASLAPLSANQLLDTQSSTPDDFFLSSIWMSGYAPAVDDAGNILVVTGNSDYSGTTYDGVTSIQESVVKVSPDLQQVLDLFTPQDWSQLDQTDGDFGSGGVLVLPDQAGPIPHLAVAAGKNGKMYLMNEDNLGGYSSTKNNVIGTYSIGGCWCGQSYFQGADGLARVVSSGGNSVGVWLLTTSPAVALTPESMRPRPFQGASFRDSLYPSRRTAQPRTSSGLCRVRHPPAALRSLSTPSTRKKAWRPSFKPWPASGPTSAGTRIPYRLWRTAWSS